MTVTPDVVTFICEPAKVYSTQIVHSQRTYLLLSSGNWRLFYSAFPADHLVQASGEVFADLYIFKFIYKFIYIAPPSEIERTGNSCWITSSAFLPSDFHGGHEARKLVACVLQLLHWLQVTRASRHLHLGLCSAGLLTVSVQHFSFNSLPLSLIHPLYFPLLPRA